MRKKKAFSLLELVMVLAIIAIIMGLGYQGLIDFRATSEMQNAYADFVGNLKILQTDAKNVVNTSSTTGTPADIYAIFISSSSYKFFDCYKASFGNSLNCSVDKSLSTLAQNPNIVFTPGSGCSGIGFSKLTTDIVSLNTSADIQNSTSFTAGSNNPQPSSCKITITHKLLQSSQKTITINIDKNSFDLQ